MLDVLREAGALVMHGDQDARQLQCRVQFPAHESEGVEELDQALEREILGLNRNDHAIGGSQSVDGHGAQRRRTVKEREVKPLANRAEPLAQTDLRSLDAGKLDGGAGEVAACRNEPEVVGARGARGLGDRHLADQAVIGGRVRLAVASESHRRVALGVEVDEQRLRARCPRSRPRG